LEDKREDVNMLVQKIKDLQKELNWEEELEKLESEEEKNEFKEKYGGEEPSKDRMDIIKYLIPKLAEKNKELYLKNWLADIADGKDKNGSISKSLENNYFK